MLRFEWSETKNRSNRKKQGIWFEEAQQVFDDPRAILYYDLVHSSSDEDRFILLGATTHGRILVVVHCDRGKGEEIIRIVSARKATPKEKRNYEKGI